MPKPCFKKKDSNPSLCSIHNVPLLSKQLPDELIGGGYKSFTYLVCPVSGSVLNDGESTNRPISAAHELPRSEGNVADFK
jgi:hypothetical protein